MRLWRWRLEFQRWIYQFQQWRMLRACRRITLKDFQAKYRDLMLCCQHLNCSPADLPREAETLMDRIAALQEQIQQSRTALESE